MSDYKRNPVTQVKNTKVDNEKYEVFNYHSNFMKTGKSSPQRRIHLTLKSLSISHISLQIIKYKLGQHFLLMSFWNLFEFLSFVKHKFVWGTGQNLNHIHDARIMNDYETYENERQHEMNCTRGIMNISDVVI